MDSKGNEVMMHNHPENETISKDLKEVKVLEILPDADTQHQELSCYENDFKSMSRNPNYDKTSNEIKISDKGQPKNNSENSRFFSCKLCKNMILFTSLPSICAHYRDVHKTDCIPQDVVVYVCFLCNDQFKSQCELEKHSKTKCRELICKDDVKTNKIETKGSWLPKMLDQTKQCSGELDSTFDCSVCKMTFSTQNDLVEHHRHEHMGKRLYTCHICNAAFSWSENLYKHMNIHQNDPIKNYSQSKICCKVCSNPFHSMVSLSSHMSLSHPSHPFTVSGTWGYEADNSSPETRTSSEVENKTSKSMKSTSKRSVNDDQLFIEKPVSKVCKTELTDNNLEEFTIGSSDIEMIEETDLSIHQMVNAVAAQNDPDTIYCNVCDKVYKDILQDTKDAMSLKCSYCGWDFPHGYQLEAHIDHLHPQDIVQSICRVCCSTLRNNTEMDRHYAKEHPDSRAFHCYQCESSFNTKSCLRGHLLRHQSIKKSNTSGQHTCPHCNMKYAHAHQLLTHITKSHQAFATKPEVIGNLNTLFICGFCSKKFNYEGSLKIHLKQHEDKIKAQMSANGTIGKN